MRGRYDARRSQGKSQTRTASAREISPTHAFKQKPRSRHWNTAARLLEVGRIEFRMHEPEQQTILDRLLTVGKAVPRSEGTAKVTGKTTYTADRMYPGMVWGKAVRSELPHAKVLHIDTSKAKAYPGVLAVLTSEDLPDVLTGRQLKDTPTLARNQVRFIGEK